MYLKKNRRLEDRADSCCNQIKSDIAYNWGWNSMLMMWTAAFKSVRLISRVKKIYFTKKNEPALPPADFIFIRTLRIISGTFTRPFRINLLF